MIIKNALKDAQRVKALIAAVAFAITIAVSAFMTQPLQAEADDRTSFPASLASSSSLHATSDDLTAFSSVASVKISTAIDIDQLCGILDEKIGKSKADLLIAKAMSLQGMPYRYGGTTPSGFDCSGFVLYCMRESLGIEMPRTAASQGALGAPVSLDELQPGDLVFWGKGRSVYHVGIYIGDGNYIHSPQTGRSVCVQPISERMPSFAKRIL